MESCIKSSQNVIVLLLQGPSCLSFFSEVIPSGWTQNIVLANMSLILAELEIFTYGN